MTIPTPLLPAVDSIRLFHQAASFDYAAGLLDFHTSVVMKTTGQINACNFVRPTVIPGTINSTLSVELYLKYLILVESGGAQPPRGHDLADLFTLLTSPAQSEIKTRHAQLVANDPDLVKLNAASRPELFTFDRELEKSRRSFERWRYYYETPTGSPGRDPQFIRQAVRNHIIERDAVCKEIWDSFPPLPKFRMGQVEPTNA